MALIGRDEDLSLLDDTLAAGRTGRGRAPFLTGEAGIGKSTLLAEARARAGAATVLAGAAWEAGGAPPYWPWQQVLRAAAERFEVPLADKLGALIPEWGVAHESALDPAAARFGLLDTVSRSLIALAARTPLVVLLDDVHAADLPTLDLLALFVRELPRASIALVCAWREGELAARPDAAQRLARIARYGTTQPVRRLTAAEVASWVGENAQVIFAATEGNPLFVEETLRSQGRVSGGIAFALADHLALAAEPTRTVLAVASVLGREFDPVLVRVLAEVPPDAVEAALRDAEALRIVERRPIGWAFRHILLRDHLYAELPPSRRAALHRLAGAALEAGDPVRAAHHWVAGIAGEDVLRAVAAARAAATRAAAVYAFEDAAGLLAAAAAALADSPAAREPIAIDILIELGDARHRLGQTAQAHAVCVRAAELARARGDIDRLSRAAMVYALELISGRRDDVMIALLEEAHTKLPAEDGSVRARVTARLAASLVPGPEPEIRRAHALARDAEAMARRLGDDDTSLFVLRYVAHALSFQISITEARDLAYEVIALSDRVGRPLDAIDHRSFLITAELAHGALAASEAALERFQSVLAPLTQPHYRWRPPLLRGAAAVRRGDFVEADRQLAAVRIIASEHQIDRALWAHRFCALGVVAASRSPERAAALARDYSAGPPVHLWITAFLSYCQAVTGDLETARTTLHPGTFIPAIIVSQFAAETIIATGDRERAAQLMPIVERQSRLHPIASGPAAGLIVRPAAQVLGELFALLGRTDEAISELEAGLALARTIEAPPFVAAGAAALAPLLDARGDRTRARDLADEAIRIARLHEIHGIEEALASSMAARPHSPSVSASPADRGRPNELVILCDGAHGRIRWCGRDFASATSKGLEYLATLVASPNHEVHVSDLVGDDDRGDAGEILDAKARSAYKQRAEELTTELDAARAANDLGRIDRLSSELEAITDELLAGTGLGGRSRKAGSRVERARVNVQRRIKDAIKRLGSEDEALGKYLDATIRTGTFCSFVPIES